MQSPSRYTSKIFTVTLIVASLAVSGSPRHAIAEEFSPDKVIYQRGLIIGTSEEIKVQVMAEPMGNTRSAYIPEYTHAKYQNPPEPNGIKIAKHFRNFLLNELEVSPLTNCDESLTKVTCTSDYIKNTNKTYIKLTYNYIPSIQMYLDLSSLRRSSAGETSIVNLDKKNNLKFNKLWNELSNIAEGKP